MSKLVVLSGGSVTVIDEEDYAKVTKHKWKLHPSGYACRNTTVDGRRTTVWLHRFLTSVPDGLEVDHKNLNKLDNRKDNLRFATRHENARNVKSQGNQCGYKGVRCLTGGRSYQAYIRVDGRHTNLGMYPTAEQAHQCYKWFARLFYGEFANFEIAA